MKGYQHQDHVPAGQEGIAMPSLAFTDNRPEVLQLKEAEGMVQDSPRAVAQRHVFQEALGEPNDTGMPDDLKTGAESLSGIDLSDVRVHYNSPMPAQLHALAYAQGNAIHLAPGEERHLPHEAWHVVQQKQNRVKPTLQLMGQHVNDDSTLEREATRMGHLASQAGNRTATPLKEITAVSSSVAPVQRVKKADLSGEDWGLVNSAPFQTFVKVDKKVNMPAGYGNWLVNASKELVQGYVAEFKNTPSQGEVKNAKPKPESKKAASTKTVPIGGTKPGSQGPVSTVRPRPKSSGTVKNDASKERKKESGPGRPVNLFQNLLDVDGNPKPPFLAKLVEAYKADLITSSAYLTEGEGHIVASDMGIIVNVFREHMPEGYTRIENDGGGDCLIHALVQANKFLKGVKEFWGGASKGEILEYRKKISERIETETVEFLCIAEVQGRIDEGQNSVFGPSFTPLIQQFPTNLKKKLPKNEKKKEEVEKPAKQAQPVQQGGGQMPCLGGENAANDDLVLFHTGGDHWVLLVKTTVLELATIDILKGGQKEETKDDIEKEAHDEGSYIDAVIRFIEKRIKQTRDERIKGLLESIKRRWQGYKKEEHPKLPYYYGAFYSGVNLGKSLSDETSHQWVSTKPAINKVKDVPEYYGPLGLSYTEETTIKERQNESREYRSLVYRYLEIKKENIALIIAEDLPDGNEPQAKKEAPSSRKAPVKARPAQGKSSNKPEKVEDLKGNETDRKNKIAQFEKNTKEGYLAQKLPPEIPVISREEAELEWALMAEARRAFDPEEAAKRHEFDPAMRSIRKEDLEENDIFCVTEAGEDNKRQVRYGIYKGGKYLQLNNTGTTFIESTFAGEKERIFYLVSRGKEATPKDFYKLISANESFAQQAESLIADLAAISVMIKSANKPEGEELTLHQLYALVSDGLTIGNHTRRVLHVYGKIGPEIAEGFLTRKEFMLLIALHDIGKGYGQSKAKDKTSGKQHDYTDQVFESLEKNQDSLAVAGVSKEKLSLIRHTINMDPIGELMRASQSGVVPPNNVAKATKDIVTGYRTIVKSNPGITLQVYFEYVLMPFYISDSASYSSHGNYSSKDNPNPLNWAKTLYPPGNFDLSTIYNHPAIKALRQQLAKEEGWSLKK